MAAAAEPIRPRMVLVIVRIGCSLSLIEHEVSDFATRIPDEAGEMAAPWIWVRLLLAPIVGVAP